MIAVLEECAEDVARLKDRVQRHSTSIAASDVGLDDPALDADLGQVCHELRQLAEMRTPVDKRRIWRNVFDLVTAAVQAKSLEVRSKVALTSDEFIPLLSLAVLRSGLDTLPAELVYLEQFSFVGTPAASSVALPQPPAPASASAPLSSSAAAALDAVDSSDSQSSYHLITMQAVKQFLLSADVFDAARSPTAKEYAALRTTAMGAGGGEARAEAAAAAAGPATPRSIAEAMLKARRSTQQLAISGAALSPEGGGGGGGGSGSGSSAASSRRTSTEAFAPMASLGEASSSAASDASPRSSRPASQRASRRASSRASPSSARPGAGDKRDAPALGPRKIELPALRQKELPSDDDVGPLLRKLRGF